jgi:hypothetical protein
MFSSCYKSSNTRTDTTTENCILKVVGVQEKNMIHEHMTKYGWYNKNMVEPDGKKVSKIHTYDYKF